MKTQALIIFLSIVTIIYGLLNFYIYSRSVHLLPSGNPKYWFTVIFWLFASSYLIARILERTIPCNFTEIVTWVGSFYLGFMVYALLAVILGDLLRLTNHLFHLFPSPESGNFTETRLLIFWGGMGIIMTLVIAGFVNARLPVTRTISIEIPKQVSCGHTMKIVMVSDIHMGTLIAKRRTNALVEKIESLKPDLILFVGDMVDEDIAPVIRRDLGGHLKKLEARYGVYAVTGNHEYIGGVEPAVKYLTDHGITMLRDTALLVHDCFYLVGRDDKDKQRFTGKPRKSLDEIMTGVDKTYPVILMDHQPFNLENAVKLGIDLQLSGHTHHGQLWPFNYITNAIYTISTGYKKIGQTHFYVSSGFGSWGPPMRLGNRPEIVVINVTFR